MRTANYIVEVIGTEGVLNSYVETLSNTTSKRAFDFASEIEMKDGVAGTRVYKEVKEKKEDVKEVAPEKEAPLPEGVFVETAVSDYVEGETI